MNLSSESELRSLNLLFESYGENDPEFKIELIMLMIGNIMELQQAAMQSYESKSAHHFRSAVHKTRSTIKILDDTGFVNAIDQLRENFISTKPVSLETIVSFGSFAGTVIKSLEHEIQRLKAG